jgi:large subunit ribosomal protein L12e
LTNRTGNVSFEEVKRIANWLHNDGGSMSKEMSGSVMQILGTARSIGLTVDGQNPKVLTEQIKSGEIRV